jgi:hypothetical protein
MTNPRNVRYASNVVRMADKRSTYKVLAGNVERKRPLGDLGINGSTIFNWLLQQ